MDGSKNPIGHWAWAAQGIIGGHETDLALIRLDPGVPFSPQICQYVGPTGEFDGNPTLSQPLQLQMYGQGDGVAAVAPGRPLVAIDSQADLIDAYGSAVGGDSGSPVVTADGLAVGDEVAIVVKTVDSSKNEGHGVVRVLRLPHQIRLASASMGIRLSLSVAGQPPAARAMRGRRPV
ncbi:MAG: hypothetical protein ACYDGR_16765 [Candidatus Dormibacteria bacterium]